MTNSTRILVLVHPGSACGSADFNMGQAEARAARAGLIDELEEWVGGVLVIDGGLSCELPDYPDLAHAIGVALAGAKMNKELSRRIEGDDPLQVQSIREFVTEMGSSAAKCEFMVTGAWYHPEDKGGCVGSVVQEIKRLGLTAEVSNYAVNWSSLEDESDSQAEPANKTQPVL